MESSILLEKVYVDGIDKSTVRDGYIRSLFVKNGKSNSAIRKINILKNINLDIKHGARIGILGQNGAGKTSLLKAILQTYPPSSGRVVVNGQILPMISMGSAARIQLSGRQNIKMLFVENCTLDQYNKDMEERIIEFSGIDKEKIDMPLKIYSSGMMARLIFSATIMQKGDILLMDEVFATGDQYFIQKCYNYMEKKWNNVSIGITISHNLPDIEKLCDYCYVMNNGEIINEGKTNDMIKFYKSFKI